jgi:hypothetical protein
MGDGDAREAVRRIPEIEFQCGRERFAKASDGIYGFLPVRPARPKG